jgi:hypothetical protein
VVPRGEREGAMSPPPCPSTALRSISAAFELSSDLRKEARAAAKQACENAWRAVRSLCC